MQRSQRSGGEDVVTIRPWWLQYGVAAVGVAVAIALRRALTPFWGETGYPFEFFYPVIALTAWLCGPSPASIAIVLSAAAADWFFVAPTHSFAVQHPTQWFAVLVFVIGGAAMVVAIHAMHRANAHAVHTIKERERAEDAMRQARNELALVNEGLERIVHQRTAHLKETIHSLERICYNIAHDLRAPTRSMQGFAQILLDEHSDALDDTAREYLRRIAASAARNDALILDLLAYGRLGHADLPCSAQDLQSHVEAAIHKLSEDFRVAGDAVRIDGPLPSVWANPLALDQALVNLLSNALKFVRPGVTPQVIIRAEELDSRVRVAVEDNGIGIPPEQHKRIFGIFERLHSEHAYPGTGIGLAIVEKSVERMGGRVWVESALGNGSRFWMELLRTGSALDAAVPRV